uniref:Uncharacterized protein n=1 Tax=Glossina pallidipes TaxID=7398 RepID=A0A1A9Z310_GLOPL
MSTLTDIRDLLWATFLFVEGTHFNPLAFVRIVYEAYNALTRSYPLAMQSLGDQISNTRTSNEKLLLTWNHRNLGLGPHKRPKMTAQDLSTLHTGASVFGFTDFLFFQFSSLLLLFRFELLSCSSFVYNNNKNNSNIRNSNQRPPTSTIFDTTSSSTIVNNSNNSSLFYNSIQLR